MAKNEKYCMAIVVDRRSFGSCGVSSSSSNDCYINCLLTKGIFEWVGDGGSWLLLTAQALNVVITVVLDGFLKILLTNKGVLNWNFDLHLNSRGINIIPLISCLATQRFDSHQY